MKRVEKLRYPRSNWRAFSVLCLIAIGFCVVQYEIYAQTKILGKPRRAASVGSRPRNTGQRINRSYRLPNRGNLSPKFNARSTPGKTFRNSSSKRAAVDGSKSTFRNRQTLRRNTSGSRYSNVTKRERLANRNGLSRYGKANGRTGQYRPKRSQRANFSTKKTTASKQERKINTGRRSSNLRQRTDLKNKITNNRRLSEEFNKTGKKPNSYSGILNSASSAYKGTTILGHALSKHAGRKPSIWGKLTGNQSTWHNQALKHFEDIMNAPGGFNKTTNEHGINFLDKRLSDGRGIRLNMNGTFKTFID